MKIEYSNYKCDFFRYEGGVPGSCPIAPSSDKAILTVNSKFTMSIKPVIRLHVTEKINSG